MCAGSFQIRTGPNSIVMSGDITRYTITIDGDDDYFTEEADKLASLISKKSPIGILGTKKTILHALSKPDVEEGLDRVATWNSSMLLTKVRPAQINSNPYVLIARILTLSLRPEEPKKRQYFLDCEFSIAALAKIAVSCCFVCYYMTVYKHLILYE